MQQLSNIKQLVIITLVILCSYFISLHSSFNSLDDYKMINSLINTDSFKINQVFLPYNYGQYYRPLLYLTFIFDKYIWGLEASPMHLENILLHLGNTILVFYCTNLFIETFLALKKSFYTPFISSIIFGLHPIATEPVNWVSGRTDLLSCFFTFTSFILFVYANKTFAYNTHSEKYLIINRTYKHYIAGTFGASFLLLGCLSKETALFLLPIILLWCILPPTQIIHERDRVFCSFFTSIRFFLFTSNLAAGISYLMLRKIALSSGDKILKTASTFAANPTHYNFTDLIDITRIIIKTGGFYLKKLLIPVPLNFGIINISPHYIWLGILLFCSIIWCLYRHDAISYLFLAAFSLASSAFLLPILKITWTPIAERYVYMASAPFVIGLVLLYTTHFISRVSPKVTAGILCLIIPSAAFVTVQRNMIWNDNLTLFADTIKKSPNFGAIRNEYAIALRERGKNIEADQILLINTVDEFQPSSLNKIRILANRGQLYEARNLLLVRLNKPSEYSLLSFELLLKIDELRREKSQDAQEKQLIDKDILTDLEKIISITNDPFYIYRLGTVQLRLNDKKSAKFSFIKAFQNAPSNSHYRDAAKKLADRL